MAQSAGKRLLFQTSHYSVASILTLIGGLVTFPLLTRVFSVRDYGLISLLSATVAVGVAFGKAGLQHSIVRYFTEIDAGKSRYTMAQLYSTSIIGMTASALLVMVVLIAGSRLAPSSWLADERTRRLIAAVSILVVVQVLDSAMTNLLRANESSVALMKYQIVKKYLSLGLMVLAILAIAPTLTLFYSATIVAETLALGMLAWLLATAGRRVRTTLAQFSRPLYRELLAMGLPMLIGYELAGLVLSIGDRYVINAVIGEEEVGLYSAAYNVCQYVQAVFIVSVGQAIQPIYMRMWDEEGAARTSAFVTRSLRTYVLIAAPVIAGVASVGPELLPSLASERYASAGRVIPWVISGMVMDGAANFVGAGLFIERRMRTLMAVVFLSAVFNVGFNLILVPRYGMVGAAVSTLGSYTLTYLGFAIFARPFLRVPLPWATIVRAGLASLVMFEALEFVLPGRRLLSVAARIAVGTVIYVGGTSLIDPDARDLVRVGLARVRGARPPRGA